MELLVIGCKFLLCTLVCRPMVGDSDGTRQEQDNHTCQVYI